MNVYDSTVERSQGNTQGTSCHSPQEPPTCRCRYWNLVRLAGLRLVQVSVTFVLAPAPATSPAVPMATACSHFVMLSSFGFVHARTALASFAVAVNPAGLAGTAMGVAVRAAEAAPPPREFTPRTLNVYVVSLSRPVTV